jgi:hypothetical protein
MTISERKTNFTDMFVGLNQPIGKLNMNFSARGKSFPFIFWKYVSIGPCLMILVHYVSIERIVDSVIYTMYNI